MKKLLLLLGFLTTFTQAQTIYYVDQNATGNNDGSSWANAFTSLEPALALQENGFTGEIRVAGGQTFTPTTSRLCTSGCDTPSDVYFLIHKDIKLKGSYIVGAETQDYSNPTILSGDIGNQNDNSDNSCHVVIATNLSNNALIDGFTITEGYARDTSFEFDDMPIQPNVNGFTIDNINGGAMLNFNVLLHISNCVFSNNSANERGGAMYCADSSPKILNTTFSNNNAHRGGGICNNNSSPTIINTTFSGNSASYEGGGVINELSNITLYNTVLYDNTPTDVYNDNNSSITTNSSNNYSETSYLVGSSFTQLTADPFVNSGNGIGSDGIWGTADDGLYPADNSVLINAGDNSFNTQSTDITGSARIVASTIDVGAYEYNSALSISTNNSQNFTVYPNPVTHTLHIQTNLNEYQYTLYNMQGQRIMQSQKAVKSIAIGSLQAGVYVLRLSSNEKTETIKIIKD